MKTAKLARNIELDALTAQLDGGFIKIYTGTQPASPEDPATGTLLATLEFGNPAYDPAVDGVAQVRAVVEDSDAAATGAAGWFRCFKSDGITPVVDGSVGTSGADLNYPSVNFQQHATVQVTTLPLTLPQ